jgi:hypothetical protein
MVKPCTCHGVTLTFDQLFALRHFVHVREQYVVGTPVTLSAAPIDMSEDEYEHMKSLLHHADSGTRLDACPAHPDRVTRDHESLNHRVTLAILVAEQAARSFGDDHALTLAAWQRVSWAEERLAVAAERSPRADEKHFEGQPLRVGYARRGAIEAAKRARDPERAAALALCWALPLDERTEP